MRTCAANSSYWHLSDLLVMSSSGFFMRSSMAQFDPVDFNCTTARAALLPTTVDLAGHRIKKQAQPFAAPVFFTVTLRAQSFLVWSAIFRLPIPVQAIWQAVLSCVVMPNL